MIVNSNELTEILSAFRQRQSHLTKQPTTESPSQLFHFTDGAGLIGILGSVTTQLWASSHRSLNDPGEIQYGEDVFSSEFDSYLTQNPQEHTRLERIRSSGRSPATGVGADCFIVSFTEDADSSMMWSKYGNQGKGFAVGFDVKQLVDQQWSPTLHGPRTKFEVSRMQYSETEQRGKVRELLRDYLETSDRINALATTVSSPGASLEDVFSNCASDLIASFKAPSYAAEKEWRVYVWLSRKSEESIQFRSVAHGLCPYILFGPPARPPFENRSLRATEVRYGFLCDSPSTESALHRLQIQKGQNFRIERSNVAMR